MAPSCAPTCRMLYAFPEEGLWIDTARLHEIDVENADPLFQVHVDERPSIFEVVV